jgi:hypothetical protein
MAKDVWSARRPRDVLGFMFGRPGWKPENVMDTKAIAPAAVERQAVQLTQA